MKRQLSVLSLILILGAASVGAQDSEEKHWAFISPSVPLFRPSPLINGVDLPLIVSSWLSFSGVN